MEKSQANKYYFNHPEIYEAVNKSRVVKEAKFLTQTFSKYGNVTTVLDAGCGSGNHLNEFAKLGFTGIGIDLNKNMVKYARHKYPDLQFQIADMRSLPFSNQFDAIICLCTTFSYNITISDIEAALKSFSKALKKNGILIIETFNPIAFIEKRKFKNTITELGAYKAMGLRSTVKMKVDERNQLLIENRSIFDLSTDKLIKKDLTKYRMFFPQEMKYLLQQQGFKFLELYGGYDMSHKELNEFRLITVAKK